MNDDTPPSREVLRAELRATALRVFEHVKNVASRQDRPFRGRLNARELVQFGVREAPEEMLEPLFALLGRYPGVTTWADAGFRSTHPSFDTFRFETRQVIHHCMSGVCADPYFVMEESRFERIEQHLWRLATEGTVWRSVIAILDGVAVDDVVDLGPVQIRRLSDAERQELQQGQFVSMASSAAMEYAVEASSWLPRRTEVDVLIDQVQGVLRALRLWSAKPVGCPLRMHRRGPFESGTGILLGSNPALGLSTRRVDDAFVALWRRLSQVLVNPPPPLDVALRRFDTMVDEGRPDDQLLDQCIVLEALLMRRNERGIRERLSLRTAHFVGKDDTGRRDVYEIVKVAYKLRSHVAHGEQPRDGRDEQKAFGSIVRTALLEYCERAASDPSRNILSEICAELDGYLLERRGD